MMRGDARKRAVAEVADSDVAALLKIIREAYLYAIPTHSIVGAPEAVLTSDWLAAHDATILATERHRITVAINAYAHQFWGNSGERAALAHVVEAIVGGAIVGGESDGDPLAEARADADKCREVAAVTVKALAQVQAAVAEFECPDCGGADLFTPTLSDSTALDRARVCIVGDHSHEEHLSKACIYVRPEDEAEARERLDRALDKAREQGAAAERERIAAAIEAESRRVDRLARDYRTLHDTGKYLQRAARIARGADS